MRYQIKTRETARKMAELTIRPEEIRDALERFVEDVRAGGRGR